jgi:hypothetical protein
MTFRRTDYIDLWRPQVTAAQSVGAQLVIGEFSSVSCSGKENVTNTFGQALCESLLWLPFRVDLERKMCRLTGCSKFASWVCQGWSTRTFTVPLSTSLDCTRTKVRTLSQPCSEIEADAHRLACSACSTGGTLALQSSSQSNTLGFSWFVPPATSLADCLADSLD